MFHLIYSVYILLLQTDVLVGKKRAIEAEAPSAKKAKSEQSAQKTGELLHVLIKPN